MRMLSKVLGVLALTCASIYAASGPRGKLLKADQVGLDTNTVYLVITSNEMQHATEQLDAAVGAAQVDIASLQSNEVFSTNNSYTYADGTTQNVDYLIVRSTATVANAVVTNLDIPGTLTMTSPPWTNFTSSDLFSSNSFFGLTNLTLTAGMYNAVETGGEDGLVTPANVYDGDLSTKSVLGATTATSFYFDLGARYYGFYAIVCSITNDNGGYSVHTFSSDAGLVFDAADTIDSLSVVQQATLSGLTTNAYLVAPLMGRYIGMSLIDGGNYSTGNVSEVLVFATTNALSALGTP